MVQRRHYFTAIFLLLLPVVVIYALTNYGIEQPTINQDNNREIDQKSAYACQQKKLKEKKGKTLRLGTANKGI